MKTRYLAALPLLAAVALGMPARSALAEAPAPIDAVRAANVRRLLITNACAECDLVSVDLSNQHLIGADLRGALLTGANLSWSNLEGADMTSADLTGADLTGAFLTNASLVAADLDGANLAEAQLYYVDVTGASMSDLNLAGATVVGTPISIGDGPEMIEEAAPPVLAPEDSWLLPPLGDPSPGEILDVPPEILPEV